MLRRYSSNGLETIPIKSKTITIGTDKCDVIVKAKGVHPVHASIEQNLESGLFWLTDHSLAGRTTVNGRLINGQVELRNGDMVRFGKAQPFVFERRNIFPLKKGNDVGEIASNANDTNLSTLPILGTKKQLSRKPTPSKSSANRSVASKLKSKRYDPYTEEISRRAYNEDKSNSASSSIDTVSSTYSDYNTVKRARGIVGSNLLQRVIRLQDELTRRNLEIEELRRQRYSYPQKTSEGLEQSSPYFPHLREPPHSSVGKNFQLEAHRCFLAMVAAKVHSFNDIILKSRHRSDSAVFSAFINTTKEPISQKLTEIEKECDVQLEMKGFSAIQRAHLTDFFRKDQNEHILVSESE